VKNGVVLVSRPYAGNGNVDRGKKDDIVGKT
jgi:hypothetical protein